MAPPSPNTGWGPIPILYLLFNAIILRIMQYRLYKTNVKDVEELYQCIAYEWDHLDSWSAHNWHCYQAVAQEIIMLELPLKEDSSSMHCDILSTLTVKLLFSFMTVALRHCVVENNSSDWMWFNFYFPKNTCIYCIVKNLWHLHDKYRLKNDCCNFDLHWCRFGRETVKSLSGCILWFYGP